MRLRQRVWAPTLPSVVGPFVTAAPGPVQDRRIVKRPALRVVFAKKVITDHANPRAVLQGLVDGSWVRMAGWI